MFQPCNPLLWCVGPSPSSPMTNLRSSSSSDRNSQHAHRHVDMYGEPGTLLDEQPGAVPGSPCLGHSWPHACSTALKPRTARSRGP